jgi:hypothetical protein
VSIGQPQGMLLNEFGQRVCDAFGEIPYHVGSSLSAMGQKGPITWRDVDVRLMLDDDVWEKMELGNPENPHGNAKWRALCIVFSEYGRHVTGLPIDFQLQQRTHANAKYGRAQGCQRSALMVVNHEMLAAQAPKPSAEVRIYQHHPLCSNLPTSPIGGYGCACRIEFGAPKPSLSADLDDPETWRGLYDELEPAGGATPSVDLAAQTQTAGSALSTGRLEGLKRWANIGLSGLMKEHPLGEFVLLADVQAALKDLPAAKGLTYEEAIDLVQEAIGQWGGPERKHYDAAMVRVVDNIKKHQQGLDLWGRPLEPATAEQPAPAKEKES